VRGSPGLPKVGTKAVTNREPSPARAAKVGTKVPPTKVPTYTEMDRGMKEEDESPYLPDRQVGEPNPYIQSSRIDLAIQSIIGHIVPICAR